ncbi:hypothetical protein PPL_05190 [Heterostelium album PN500]|uniref:Uncharacterized protein n=1 Tax=Heterostelium pallidum (strain ATCC 26659 / Pp 5 / PN500) TaxID=670386 RepID=D3B9P4_HETP5|nr:hypothetical protein PPL_05190 [Heterostelium album PN500]EFA81956.1 hypothetical protein PPL_05190 [Heterostelium album PN500]|eukprot:XP_020434073.1 hypothetical protein PPL_05190 [Heterostelium album PN500]
MVKNENIEIIHPPNLQESCTLTIIFASKIIISSVEIHSNSRLIEMYYGEMDDYLATMKSIKSDDERNLLVSSQRFKNNNSISQLKIKFCSLLQKDCCVLNKISIHCTKVSKEQHDQDQEQLAQKNTNRIYNKQQSLDSMMAIMSLLSKNNSLTSQPSTIPQFPIGQPLQIPLMKPSPTPKTNESEQINNTTEIKLQTNLKNDEQPKPITKDDLISIMSQMESRIIR